MKTAFPYCFNLENSQNLYKNVLEFLEFLGTKLMLGGGAGSGQKMGTDAGWEMGDWSYIC